MTPHDKSRNTPRNDHPEAHPDDRPGAHFDDRPGAHFDDRRMEMLIGRLLQTGVSLASIVVLTGGVLYLATHLHAPADYGTFRGVPQGLRSPRAMIPLLATGDPAAIMQLGVLLLIATPIARVVFAVVGFAMERDRMYIAVSATVLAVLLFSLFR